MILYVNCCIRPESRTDRLARALLRRLEGPVTERKVHGLGLSPLSPETLNRRTALIEAGDYSDPMFDLAKEFAAAEQIVISAPYWDLSFPAELKVYLENIYVTGIVSEYDETGRPRGLCRGKKLWYVTTAGGPYEPAYSYGFLRDLARNYLGIPETALVKAEFLDIVGSDPEAILESAITALPEMAP